MSVLEVRWIISCTTSLLIFFKKWVWLVLDSWSDETNLESNSNLLTNSLEGLIRTPSTSIVNGWSLYSTHLASSSILVCDSFESKLGCYTLAPLSGKKITLHLLHGPHSIYHSLGLEHEASLLDKPESPLSPSLNTKSKNIAERCGVGEQEVPKDRGLQNRQNWSIVAAARIYHVFKGSVSRTVR